MSDPVKPAAPTVAAKPVGKAPSVPVAAVVEPAPAKAPAVTAPAAPAPRRATRAAKKPAATTATPAKTVASPKPARDVPTPAARVAAPAKDPQMTDMKSAADQAQAQAKTMFADASTRGKAAMEKGAKFVEEMNAFGKGNIEAMVESSKIYAKGAEAIAKYSADYARESVEKANATARQFAAVKSPTEFFQLQSEVAKSTFDAMAAETAKFAENYVKLMGEVAQPIQNRLALAAEKVKVAA